MMFGDDVCDVPDLHGRTLLVLGAAGNSKPGLYRAAARRGLRIVLAKARPADWELPHCADVLPVDCANYDDLDQVVASVTAFAGRHAADGVTTTFDAAVPALAEVAARLGLVGIPVATAAVLRDKFRMREHFRILGLPSARSIPTRSPAEALAAAERLGYPLVVKPVMGTGSAGVLRVGDAGELVPAYRTAAQVVRSMHGTHTVLVEEYLDGMEVCVDALVHRGQVVFENITDHPLGVQGATFEGVEYVTPTALPQAVAQEVYRLNRRTLAGLDLTDAVTHTEIKVTAAGPRLVETHPRVCGHRMPEIVRLATGVDLLGGAVDIAMGLAPAVDRATTRPAMRVHAAYRCVCPPRSGALTRLDGVDAAAALPGVLDIDVQVSPGSPVTALPDAIQQNIAFIVAHGPDYQTVRERAEAAARTIEIAVDEAAVSAVGLRRESMP